MNFSKLILSTSKLYKPSSLSFTKRTFYSSNIVYAKSIDPYSVLNVSKDSSQADIKKAYYKLAKQFHPDTNKGDKNVEKKFQEVNAAYEILGNDDKRRKYDTYGSVEEDMGMGGGPSGGNPFNMDPMDIFSQFESQFGANFGDFLRNGQGGRRAQRGADVDVKIVISFMEAVKGATKEIKVERMKSCEPCTGTGSEKGSKPIKCTRCKGTGYATVQQGPYVLSTVCPKCSGQGQSRTECKPCKGAGVVPEKTKLNIQVPAGVANGQSIRLSNQGSAASGGSSVGNLWVHVEVQDHPVFQREDYDIHVYVPVPLSMACLGGSVVVPTISGEVDLKVPDGTKSGDRLVMRSKGIVKPNGLLGSQYVHLDVIIPKTLTPKQKELMVEFKKEEDNQPAEKFEQKKGNTSSWFSKFSDLWASRNKGKDSSERQ